MAAKVKSKLIQFLTPVPNWALIKSTLLYIAFSGKAITVLAHCKGWKQDFIKIKQ